MAKHIDLVRYRNDGDDFHILWTARRALRLLDSATNLVAVSVEGISEQEAGSTEEVDAGLLVVDTTEYYGAEALTEASQVIYYQLKYSTTAPDTPWTISGLKGTIEGFAERFKELSAHYDPDTITAKVRFRFVSNRPIHEVVIAAFDAAAASVASGKLNPDVRKMIGELCRITKLKAVEFKFFAALVDLWGNQETRWTQSAKLQAETVRLTPFLDLNASLKMKELVRSKTTSDAAKDKTIRLNTLLRAFGLGNERELLPAEPRFESVAHAIPRVQEPYIIQSILDAQSPVIVHALGGVGKSILAQRLPSLLPDGSEAVVFDGFAAGAYRSPVDRRHKHSHGLVQIANTLAKRGLCDVLLPIPTSEEDYLRAFRNRMEQAVTVVRSRSLRAVLLIVLDAADNSGIAADQYQERCFAPDLLRVVPPEGCRIVALARSHRVDEFLHPPANVIRILLEPFTIGESAEHLRRKFPQARDAAVEEFHRLTDRNPRVQANALASAHDLIDLMNALGPTIHTVEDLIKGQLKTALDKVVEEQASSRSEIDSLCIALAALPPLVPIRVLSRAANMSEAAIRSFASDFAGGRPILIHDDAVQFRDEPVETWFRETFAVTSDQYGHIVNLLSPIALKDGYIAAALPLLLWGAGRYRDLVDLALRGEELETDDPVERRDVLLSRVQYALRAALTKKHFEDGVKLLLRIGEEVATNERQAAFLMDNSDLVASLSGHNVVYDFIFRKRAWNISATPYVYCAAMLAGNQQFRVEAQRFLDLSLDWLDEWIRTPSDQRQEISIEDIAAYAWTYFHLSSPAGAAGFLASWTPPTVSFKAGGILARQLIDCENIDSAQELLVAAEGDIFLKLAVILELSRVCVSPASDQILSNMRMLGAEPSLIDLSNIPEDLNVGLAIVTAAEAAARNGLPKSDILNVLDRYRVIPERVIHSYDPKCLREAMFRNFALRAALDGRAVTMDEVMPDSIRKQMENPHADHIIEVREFKEIYGALLPWYRLRARALVKSINEGELNDLLIAAQKECKTDRWSWGGNPELTTAVNEIGKVWLDVLVWSGFVTTANSHQLGEWLESQKIMIFTPTWTSLARCVAQRSETHETCLEFASRARELIEGEHGDARATADSLADLARATFPLDRKEAASYFQLALEHLSRLGDELHERLSSLMTIAIRAGQAGHPQPRQAYRFARIVELFHAYNDHKFPWPNAAVTVAALCPVSGFAIVSRWNDRDKGSLDDTLPPMVIALLEKDILPPSVAAALHAFPGYWRLYDKAHLFLDKETDPGRRQEILDTLVLDQELAGNPEAATNALLQAARRHQLRCDRLDELAVFSATKIRDSAETPKPEASIAQRSTVKEPDWAAILAKGGFDTPEGIDETVAIYRSNVGFYQWGELLQRMRMVLKPNQWVDHVLALAGSFELQAHLLLDSLEAAAVEWNTSAAVRRAIAKAVKIIVKNRPHDLVNHWWGIRNEVERCGKLSGMSEIEILGILLEAMADHIGDVSAGALFYLAGDIAWDVLTPAQALDTLGFGLDRLESLLKENDGDGPWSDNLMPLADVPRAIAGFLYAMLASPEPEKRWRAAHAVRRLCRFRQHDVISALIELLDIDVLPPFTDAGLPFYVWHARLYLLIALARAGAEVPDVLLTHLPIFIHWALDGPPHVLIRHFSAQAALAIAQAHTSAIEAEIVERLKTVNTSPFVPEPGKDGPEVGRGKRTWKETEFHFEYDFDKYWLDPLADVFNISYAEVAKRAESWIIGKWNKDTRGRWDEDPRRRRFYRFRETMIGHGRCPAVDDHSFYLSYHAIFCAAGELLIEKPTSSADDLHGGWDVWLKEHLLTRPDGKWLADRRDFAPLERRRWQQTKETWDQRQYWRWSILGEDFDQALGVAEPDPQSMVVWGRWNISEEGHKENISVSSALVTTKTSFALLRALQTVENSHDYLIPPERDGLEITEQGFRMTGWILNPYPELELDRCDPFAGKIPWPGFKPGKRGSRIFGLTPGEEGRLWLAGESIVMRSCVWGDRNEDRYNRAGNYGERLTANLDFLLGMLRQVNRDLIIEVEINRDDDRKEVEVEYKYRFYTRLYLLRADGELHTLERYRRLRSPIS